MSRKARLITQNAFNLVQGVSAVGDPNDDFLPVEIVYHKLQLSVSTAFGLSYSYQSGSGVYFKGEGDPITDNELPTTLADLQSGNLPMRQGLYNTSRDAPDMVVIRPCYVAIELVGPQSVWFQPNQLGLQVDSDKTKNYCSLYHYDSSFERYDNAPSGCYLLCFGAQNIPDDGSTRIDDCNLYLQADQATNGPLLVTLDPHVKNRGGVGGLGGTGARAVRRQMAPA